MKKTVSRILIIVLTLVLLASVVLPAFAAEYASDSTDTAPSVMDRLATSPYENPAVAIAILAILVLAIGIIILFCVKVISMLVFRSNIKKLADEHFAYVQLTELPLKLILAHFSELAGGKAQLRSIKRHFLEELYSLFVTKKSEELAEKDASTEKSRMHLSIRAELYRKQLEGSYPYQDFLNLLPLDTDAARLL